MSSAASASSSSDPRRPDRIVEYKPEVKRIEDDDPDVPGFVALVLAVVGLMIRNRTCLWIGMIFSVESYLNQRASEGGLMGSPAATILFSISSLVMNYLPELVALYSGVKI
ncbi:Protein Asterix [Mortierella antarctica]|nr:Protein Asterix [Mortierella alpina]KAF9985489.1 Protein Asterix [Mortierella antarctica]